MAIYALDGETPELPAKGRYWVAETASVIGRVRLAEDVSIWFSATIRADNEWIEIGAGTNIQDNCVLHCDEGFPLSIGTGCTLGHSAVVHGCSIGDNCLIGMGATVLNGARIGSNSIVGAGALVTEGKEFPDGSLILGAPARAVRKLDAAAIERMRQTGQNYRDNLRRYADTLTRIDG